MSTTSTWDRRALQFILLAFAASMPITIALAEPLAFLAMSDLKKAKGDWVITVRIAPPS